MPSNNDLDRFFMCRPDFFEVSYVINPWMEGNVGRTKTDLAKKEWDALYKIVASKAKVELIDPACGHFVFKCLYGFAHVFGDLYLRRRYGIITSPYREKLSRPCRKTRSGSRPARHKRRVSPQG